ncbi:50S ribosome-binding GTPase [Rugosimonospora acidiphila]|uniref:50S ribosome-binding GTPase n=1 Tax=Rugosimonospora acidiphila TaxID=556531 RepID=A0ABP9SKX3_9ACTN
MTSGWLEDRVWMLLNDALAAYRDSPRAFRWLQHHAQRFEEPLRIAVAGPPQVGKSTLINAIVGEGIAPVEVDGGAEALVWYQDGAQPRATLHSPHESVHDLTVTRLDRWLHVDSPTGAPENVNEIVVDWPTRTLRHTILIDTPGAVAPGTAAPDGPSIMDRAAREADAMLYLVRRAPGTELNPLRMAPDTPVGRAAPVQTILVLSRADEVGGGRIDGLLSAKQLARRHRRDVRMRGLCQNVVAVAGLIAEAGRTMREPQYAALAELAALDREGLDGLLLSTDRFLGASDTVQTLAVRQDLLNRLGLVGVRLATTLIRQGGTDLGALAGQLVRRSGLTELRESISQLFVERRGLLKARSALLALEFVLRAEPRPAATGLSAEVERTVAGAHEFRELRLMAALRGGRIRLPSELDTEAQRLIGMEGTDVSTRLAADEQATGAQLWALGSQALDRWVEHAENPLLSHAQQGAARTVVRSCEGILAELAG